MSKKNSQGTVIWTVDKYDIQLGLFTNEEAIKFALLQWTPSNAREQSEYYEMEEFFERNPIMKLCAGSESEIILDNYNAFHFEHRNVEFSENPTFQDAFGNMYVYKKLETSTGDKYRLSLKYHRSMNDGMHEGTIELCVISVIDGKATVQVEDYEYDVKCIEK